MIWLTDIKTNQRISINSKYVVAVFLATEGEFQGKTFVGLTNGNIVVIEEVDYVVQLIESDK